MLERVTAKSLPVVNRAADYVPVAPACCNVCRTCTTANLVSTAAAGVVALGALASRLLKRAAP